ncbi:hypothetical protein BP6252_04953 [Coleophoma cylindrospora]|uniref:Uncharacterized protein n=1 Tax=Coleophoma cylindrospora TaxID=1849047 RepID=A0A3D8S207_9HELO|nr:hypothetical protein BP6252_04953 [Coleophoma cylindrospora]
MASPKKSVLADPILIFQLILAAYACYATWGLNVLDGSVGRMLDIFKTDMPVLTGTNAPVKTRFTGIPPIDYWIVFMIVFFWEALNGSHPATIIEGLYFFGQVSALWTLMCLEGKRIGNQGLVVGKAMMWLYITHNLTIACFAPIYFILHHQSSPTSRTTGVSTATHSRVLSTIRHLRYLPLSIFLGLMVPFSYTGLPSPDVISYTAQQNAIAFTIFYPTWVVLLNYTFAWLDATFCSSDTPTDLHDVYMRALRPVYIFAIVIGAFMHIGVVVTSLASVVFPGVFAPGIPELFHPLNLLLPTNPPVYTIGAGIFNFMKRDQWIGYLSMWLWVLKCYQENAELAVKTWGQAMRRGVEVIASVSLLGAGGAAALFLWRRDELLCVQEKADIQEKATNGRQKA